MAATASEETQVVEFDLGDDRYCIDIEYVAEITDVGTLTPIPNASRHVRGVMDLRGRTTSIVDPRSIFSLPEGDGANNVIVFDAAATGGELTDDAAAVGWLVDEVTQVVSVGETDLQSTSIETDDSVRGILRRDDSFVIWVDPSRVAY